MGTEINKRMDIKRWTLMDALTDTLDGHRQINEEIEMKGNEWDKTMNIPDPPYPF